MEPINARGQRGDVTVAVFVDEHGLVREAKIQTGFGRDAFDQAALEAARKFQYRPGMTNCETAEKWTTIRFSKVRQHSGP